MVGYIFKISLYGIGKYVTRFERLCTLTHYSSDNNWRVTAVIVHRKNEKLHTKERTVALLTDILKAQMIHTSNLYETQHQHLAQIICLLTCSDTIHPYKYDTIEYLVNHHAQSLLYKILPTSDEAYTGEVSRLVDKVANVIEMFYDPPTLIREPTISWRVDFYFRDYTFKGSYAEISRLMGIVMDPSEYDRVGGLKVYVGRLGDYMVCRSIRTFLFVIEQRLKDYLASNTNKKEPAPSLPTTLYGYMSSDVQDVVGKYRSYRSYEALHVKTRAMFAFQYTYDDYEKTDVSNLARMIYRALLNKITLLYSK